MALQHREFQTCLRDAERLRLYALSAFFDQKALSASLMEAESNSRRWESEAKEATERAVRAKEERDTAFHEVTMARMETEATASAQAQVESELARVQRALVASKDT